MRQKITPATNSWRSSLETMKKIGMFPYFPTEFKQDEIGFEIEGTVAWSHKDDSFAEVVCKVNSVVYRKISNQSEFEVRLATVRKGPDAKLFSKGKWLQVSQTNAQNKYKVC